MKIKDSIVLKKKAIDSLNLISNRELSGRKCIGKKSKTTNYLLKSSFRTYFNNFILCSQFSISDSFLYQSYKHI